MDESEALVERYLKGSGITDLQYEPDGNVPPDFLAHGSIAIEVRRLNVNHDIGGEVHGLEEASISLRRRFERLLDDFGPQTAGQSWYVLYSFRRPLPPWNELRRAIVDVLKDFRQIRNETQVSFRVAPSLRLTVARSSPRGSLFALGGMLDLDETGWVVPMVTQNLLHCIAEKSIKVTPHLAKYWQWWLAMPDYTGSAITVLEDGRLAPVSTDVFDRVILIDPYSPGRGSPSRQREFWK